MISIDISYMTTQETDQQRLEEVLNVMLLHITHLNVTAIGLEGKRKEIVLEDSLNTTDLAEWFKANYIDVTETTAKTKMYLHEKTKKGMYVYTSNLQKFNGKLTTDENYGDELELDIVGRG